MNSLEFLESEREIELNVGGGIGIVGEFLVVVEAVVLRTHPEVDVPLHAVCLPFLEEFHLCTWPAEEFHLHLLELPHAENELACHDFISECLSDLGDSERNLHPAGLLDIEILHENALGGLRTEVNLVVGITGIADLGAEHQVELTHVGPVGSSGNRVNYTAVEDDLLVLLEVIGLLSSDVAVVYFIVLCLFAENVRICLAELGLVEILAEFLAPLGYFLLDFLLYFSEVVLDEIVCTISLLGVLIVNERVIESSYVTGSNPCLRMHEHAGINADHIFVKTGHRLPPIPLDIVLEFHSHLTIVINCSQTVINLAGREYESIFLAMRHQDLEKFFLCHKCLSINYLHYNFLLGSHCRSISVRNYFLIFHGQSAPYMHGRMQKYKLFPEYFRKCRHNLAVRNLTERNHHEIS